MKFKFACLALIGLSNLAFAESKPVNKMLVSCSFAATIFTVPTDFNLSVDLGNSETLELPIWDKAFTLTASLLSEADRITAGISLKDLSNLSLSGNRLQSEIRNVQIGNELSMIGVIGEDGSTIVCDATMD